MKKIISNRIEKKFLELKKEKRKALVSFITAGDPNLKTSQKIMNLLPSFGTDIVEIGIPFSDPMADGPTIQKSSQRAIKSGTNLKKTLEIVKNFRTIHNHTPVVLMGYFNPIFQFGLVNFFSKASRVGVDGLIIVDLPPEENQLIENLTKKFNIHNIRLLTPTSDKGRLKKILKSTSGFLYYVSIMGITGTKKPSISSVKKSITQIKKHTNLPVLVGFGINNSRQVYEINKFADGCVVGSAIIKILEKSLIRMFTEKEMLKKINEFLLKLKKAC